jgi:PAS domain S-box-containing protein
LATERPLVYVLEPDTTLAALLEEILQTEGYAVSVFSTEAPAAAQVSRDAPGLAVMAFRPGDQARREAVRRIRRLRKAIAPSVLPVIGLTGDYQQLRQAAGSFGHLTDFALLAKPFGLDELLDVVRSMLLLAERRGLAALLDVPVGVLIADGRGHLVHGNGQALAALGYSVKDLGTLHVSDLLHDGAAASSQDWPQFLRERPWTASEMGLRHRDGQRLLIKAHANVMMADDGAEPLYVTWLRE